MPTSFKRDDKVAFVEGGWLWRDGVRRFAISSDPNPGILSGNQFRGSMLCRDTLDGIPIIVETSHPGSKCIVTACVPERDNIGYYALISGVSSDSSDQALFLSMIRTLHQTGRPSGKRKWFGRHPVEVHSRTHADRSGVRYAYRIVNRSNAPIASLRVGFDQDFDFASIAYKRKDVVAGGAQSPRGWTVKFVTHAINGAGFLEWNAVTGKRAIAPGASLSGFSIRTDKPDGAFWDVRWTAYPSSGDDELWFSGELIHDPAH